MSDMLIGVCLKKSFLKVRLIDSLMKIVFDEGKPVVDVEK